MPHLDDIVCILVRLESGEEIFVPFTEYKTNPPVGSYWVRADGRKLRLREH